MRKQGYFFESGVGPSTGVVVSGGALPGRRFKTGRSSSEKYKRRHAHEASSERRTNAEPRPADPTAATTNEPGTKHANGNWRRTTPTRITDAGLKKRVCIEQSRSS